MKKGLLTLIILATIGIVSNADNKNINLISSELKNLSDQCRNLKIDYVQIYK